MKYEIKKNPTVYDVIDVAYDLIDIDLEYGSIGYKEAIKLTSNWTKKPDRYAEIILRRTRGIFLGCIDHSKFRKKMKEMLMSWRG